MSDVPGKFYRATKVRTGVAPSSAGSIEGEVLPPVNPPGSSLNSVGLTMPSAFTVSNSPLTANGTIGVTGAGTVAQYIRGDGSLADFPESSGGGSSVSYYLNGSVDQGTIGGIAYKELSKVPILGAGTDFSINADGYIASFITDAGDPSLLEIPGGNWNFETYFSASSSGGTPTFYVELYKVSGTTATLIASSSSAPELIAFGTNLTPYFSSLAVPTTTLALTDRLAVRYYVTHSGRTITLHTENNHLCQIITTFTTGLTALNGLTAQVQNFAVGTTGTDFNIASATATHTFNLPTASATNRGALSSADWSLFTQAYNDKINSAAVTGTTTKTLTLTQQDGGTITASWSDLNTDAVLSVFGRTGAVVAANGDYTTAQVTESGNLYYTDARSRAALSFAAGSGAYNTSTGVITIPTNNNQIANGAGYITSAALSGYVQGSGSAGQVAYWSSGSAITGESNLFWDATNNRLGINNSTPEVALDLGNTGGQKFYAYNGGSGNRNGLGLDLGGSSYELSVFFAYGASDNGRITFGSLNGSTYSTKMTIFGNGNVNIIGNLTANGNLFLANDGTYGSTYITLGFGGTSNGSNRIFAGTSSSVDGIFIAAATGRPIGFRAGGGTTDNLYIASTGAATFSSSVTIQGGNSLFVNNDGNTRSGFLRTSNNGTELSSFAGAGEPLILIAPDASATMRFYTAGSTSSNERMRIFSGGNVRIGPSTDGDNGARLQVSGTATFSGIVGVNGATEAGWALKSNGNLKVENNNGTTVLQVADTASGGKTWSLISSGSGNAHSVPAGTFYLRNSSDGLTALSVTSSGNVGIGTPSPTSGKLEIQTSSTTSALWVQTGGTTSSFTIADFRTGTNLPALQILGNGVSYFGGNVGIGIDTPSRKLQIREAGTSTSGDVVAVRNDNSTSGAFINFLAGGGNAPSIGAKGNDLVFTADNYSGAERMRLTSGGYLKLPQSRILGDSDICYIDLYNPNTGNLSIVNTSTNSLYGSIILSTNNTQRMTIDSTGEAFFNKSVEAYSFVPDGLNPPSSGMYAFSPDGIAFSTNTTNRLTIRGNGRVGIGTPSPSGKLSLGSDTGRKLFVYDDGGGANDIGGGMGTDLGGFSAETSIFFGNYGGSGRLSIGAWTSSQTYSTKLTVFANGNVIIGATTTIGPAAGRLDLLYSGLIQYGMNIRSSHTDGIAISFVNSSGTQVGTIYQNSSSTAYNTSSDYRLKEDLKEFNGIDLINKIKTYDFKWKSDNSRSYGVVAHELQEVINYAVYGQKDSLTMQGVDYSKLVPILIKAIQEQQVQIDKLKN